MEWSPPEQMQIPIESLHSEPNLASQQQNEAMVIGSLQFEPNVKPVSQQSAKQPANSEKKPAVEPVTPKPFEFSQSELKENNYNSSLLEEILEQFQFAPHQLDQNKPIELDKTNPGESSIPLKPIMNTFASFQIEQKPLESKQPDNLRNQTVELVTKKPYESLLPPTVQSLIPEQKPIQSLLDETAPVINSGEQEQIEKQHQEYPDESVLPEQIAEQFDSLWPSQQSVHSFESTQNEKPSAEFSKPEVAELPESLQQEKKDELQKVESPPVEPIQPTHQKEDRPQAPTAQPEQTVKPLESIGQNKSIESISQSAMPEQKGNYKPGKLIQLKKRMNLAVNLNQMPKLLETENNKSENSTDDREEQITTKPAERVQSEEVKLHESAHLDGNNDSSSLGQSAAGESEQPTELPALVVQVQKVRNNLNR